MLRFTIHHQPRQVRKQREREGSRCGGKRRGVPVSGEHSASAARRGAAGPRGGEEPGRKSRTPPAAAGTSSMASCAQGDRDRDGEEGRLESSGGRWNRRLGFGEQLRQASGQGGMAARPMGKRKQGGGVGGRIKMGEGTEQLVPEVFEAAGCRSAGRRRFLWSFASVWSGGGVSLHFLGISGYLFPLVTLPQRASQKFVFAGRGRFCLSQ